MSVVPASPNCPAWCTTDHADQTQTQWHGVELARGFETDSHGPIYQAVIEFNGSETKLWVEVNSITLTADQASVLGAALTRGAAILRESGNAASEIALTDYWDGRDHVSTPAAVYPPTPAELAG